MGVGVGQQTPIGQKKWHQTTEVQLGQQREERPQGVQEGALINWRGGTTQQVVLGYREEGVERQDSRLFWKENEMIWSE